MKIGHLKELLKEVPDDLEAGPWLKTAAVWTTPALTFDEAGKAIRVMIGLVGKPVMNYNHDASGRKLNHRTVIWKLPLEKHVICAQALADVGITSVKSDAQLYFTLRIPYEAYVTAFYTSDDPVVWRVEQEKAVVRAEQKAAKKEANRLKKEEESNKKWEESNKEWREKWEKEQALKKAQQEEQERLIALGMEAQEAQKKASEIKVLTLVDSRDIKIEGD